MVSHHFGSKIGLWRAVVDAVALDHRVTLLEELTALNVPARPLAARLKDVLDLLLDRLAERPETVMFAMREIWLPGERLDYLVEHLILPGVEACRPL